MDEAPLPSLPVQVPLGFPILTLTRYFLAFAPTSLVHRTRMGAQTGEAIGSGGTPPARRIKFRISHLTGFFSLGIIESEQSHTEGVERI